LLYVGRARDLRQRLRSYFRSDRQRPAVEAALGAVERIEWRVLGSELEAALAELRLIRELRPPANARVARPDRYVWLRKRGGGGAHLEIEAGLAATRRPGELDLDELFLVATFLRKPPPELRIVPLEKQTILRAAAQVTKHTPSRTRPATALPDMSALF